MHDRRIACVCEPRTTLLPKASAPELPTWAEGGRWFEAGLDIGRRALREATAHQLHEAELWSRHEDMGSMN